MEKTPIIIFGEFLKELREKDNSSVKNFSYQLELSKAEYTMIEEGIEIKYLTNLRRSIIPFLLHFEYNKEICKKFRDLYDKAIEFNNEREKELYKASIKNNPQLEFDGLYPNNFATCNL